MGAIDSQEREYRRHYNRRFEKIWSPYRCQTLICKDSNPGVTIRHDADGRLGKWLQSYFLRANARDGSNLNSDISGNSTEVW